MLENIEEKIKKSAIIIFCSEILLYLICTYKLFYTRRFFEGIMILAFGLLFSWTSSLALYGFGELIKISRVSSERIKLNMDDKKALLEEMKIKGLITKRDYFLERLKLKHESEQTLDEVNIKKNKD